MAARVSLSVALLILAVLAFTATGCSESRPNHVATTVCRALGLCDEPVEPAVGVDVLCDASLGSSCNRQTLSAALEPVLQDAAKRPGSRVRLWTLGRDFSSTIMVGEQTSPPFTKASERSRHAAATRFVNAGKDYFLTAAAHALDAQPVRRSPIAEAISKIALADAGGLPRHLVLVTDAREVSDVGDLECGFMPTDALFAARLKRQHLLEPGLLTGVSIEFVFLSFAPTAIRGCTASVDRQMRLRTLWSTALRGAGAASVRIGSGPPVLDAVAPGKSQNGGT